MYVQCWDGPQGTGTTDVSQGLLDMGLQVAADTNGEYPIDFCVTHVGVELGECHRRGGGRHTDQIRARRQIG